MMLDLGLSLFHRVTIFASLRSLLFNRLLGFGHLAPVAPCNLLKLLLFKLADLVLVVVDVVIDLLVVLEACGLVSLKCLLFKAVTDS